MENKYFYPNETFDTAILKNDKGVLKALLVGIIGSDPTFATDEYSEALQYISNKSSVIGRHINLEEEYAQQEDEYKIENEQDWTEEYYQMNLVWLRDNFSTKTRLPLIRTVGKYVYRNRSTMGKAKVKQNSEPEKEKIVRATVDDYDEKRLQPIWIKVLNWGGVAALIVVIYVLVQIMHIIRG